MGKPSREAMAIAKQIIDWPDEETIYAAEKIDVGMAALRAENERLQQQVYDHESADIRLADEHEAALARIRELEDDREREE